MPDCEPLQPHISPSDFMSRWLAISPAVERFCMRRLANREECGEIMQQVAFNAWSGYPSLREINCFEAWIFKLAHNEINRLIRYKMRFKATSVSLEDQDIVDPNSTLETEMDHSIRDINLKDIVAKVTALGVLTGKEASVVRLRIDSKGTSWDETGGTLGISANDCAAAYCRAIPKIRTWILCHHPEVLGGSRALLKAAQKARLAEHEPLSDLEFEVFRARILGEDTTYHRSGWRTALRSACQKVLSSLDFK